MKRVVVIISVLFLILACERDDMTTTINYDNPEIDLEVPPGFPPLNPSFNTNRPTKYGVALGEKLFHEKRFSGNNTISCASCHNPAFVFTDRQKQAFGIHERVGLRNTPPLQNLAFMKFYNWDGNMLQLEKQALVPIITHEEMDSSILEIIEKLKKDQEYVELFRQAFGDRGITADRIYKSLAQYQYTLIASNSKYDRVIQNSGESFTESESRGYLIFQAKCENCHSTALFTDQSFRNIGFPLNPSSEEAGRARVTGLSEDYMSFRVPSLRNIEYTAPYGSFGQFSTLIELLDYLDSGVLYSENLDPMLKNNGNRIPLTDLEKQDIIAFLKTLSDEKAFEF